MELGELRRLVENEISACKYEVPQGSVGNPRSPAKVESHLQKMRESGGALLGDNPKPRFEIA